MVITWQFGVGQATGLWVQHWKKSNKQVLERLNWAGSGIDLIGIRHLSTLFSLHHFRSALCANLDEFELLQTVLYKREGNFSLIGKKTHK